MSERHPFPKNAFCSFPTASMASLLLVVTATISASAQTGQGFAFHPNQEVRVSGLASPAAASSSLPAVLATAIEIILHDRAVCCGKGAALEDLVLSAPLSLQELGNKLQGAHVMGDGRSVVVNAEYVSQRALTPDLLIGTLLDQHAPLIDWKSHFYVLYGAVFDETLYPDGSRQCAIKRLLLRDPRFSDARAEVEFNREKDDFGAVHGLLILSTEKR